MVWVRAAVMAVCLLFALLVVNQWQLAVVRKSGLHLALGLLAGVYVVCLWRLRSWARKAARLIIAAALCIGIAGVFNPFHAIDYAAAHGGAAPDWGLWIAVALPFVVLGLACFWVFGRYRQEFH